MRYAKLSLDKALELIEQYESAAKSAEKDSKAIEEIKKSFQLQARGLDKQARARLAVHHAQWWKAFADKRKSAGKKEKAVWSLLKTEGYLTIAAEDSEGQNKKWLNEQIKSDREYRKEILPN